jgi:hypothetical protein
MLLRHTLRKILVDHNITSEQFLRELASSLEDPLQGRCWDKEDFSYVSDPFTIDVRHQHFELLQCQYSLSELKEVITAIPDIDWNDVKDAPLLRLILDPHRSFGATSNVRDEANDEPYQVLPLRSVQRPVPSPKRKRVTRVKSLPTAVTAAIDTFVSPFFDGKFTVVGEPSFLDDEKLSRGQPNTQKSTDDAKYKVWSLTIVVACNGWQ